MSGSSGNTTGEFLEISSPGGFPLIGSMRWHEKRHHNVLASLTYRLCGAGKDPTSVLLPPAEAPFMASTISGKYGVKGGVTLVY